MEVIKLTRDLIKIPSPSGEEKEIGKFLVKRLQKNFKVTTQKVGNRFNILAQRGRPNLILTTHIDTVSKIIPFKEDKEYLYGRGACDTKGIIASMICAAEEAINQGITNFGLVFDVSEETDFSGIKKAINLVNPELVIVGEPTDFKKVIGQKGLLSIKLKCYGKAAHSSIPEKGISAIVKLVEILSKILQIELPSDPILGKTTLNIGLIKGGIAGNVIPDYAEAKLNIRTTTSNKEIIDLLPKENIEIRSNFEPVNSRNLKGITVPYFTEMYFWAKKAKTILIGPGKYEFAHSDNERISKKDLIKGKELYLNLIKSKSF